MMGAILGWLYVVWIIGTFASFMLLDEEDYYRAPIWPWIILQKILK